MDIELTTPGVRVDPESLASLEEAIKDEIARSIARGEDQYEDEEYFRQAVADELYMRWAQEHDSWLLFFSSRIALKALIRKLRKEANAEPPARAASQ
jgi:hypothetical protein